MIQAGHAKTDQIRQAINNEDYKRAIKLATKLEKNDLAKAMLAYALERLGKRDEALDICETLQSTTNESVLIWISHVLMLAKKHKDIAKMHVKAFESASPQHVERYCALGVNCFESLVRTYDLAEAQTQALRLAKASSTGALEKSSIWLWTSTLAFLRSAINCGPDDPTLQLSEAFLLKAEGCAKPNKHLNGLPLKRWILMRRNKTEIALKTLSFLPDESPSAKVWTRSLLLRDLATQEAEEEEFNILLNMIQTLSEAHDDFRSIARLARLACKKLDSRETALRSVLDELVKANEKLRGPLLGFVRLELEKLFVGQVKGSGQALREAIVRYVTSKGHLSAAFPDLQNDLGVFAPKPSSTGNDANQNHLPGDELSSKGLICPFLIPPNMYATQDRQSRRWSIETLERFTVEDNVRTDLITDLSKDDRISAHQIMRFVGADSSKSDAELDQLWRKYLNNADRETSEQGKDDWTLLAAHVLIDLYHRSNPQLRDHYLIVALGALDKRSTASPDNFQLKLAMNEIAGHYLGAGRVALEAYRGLRVKQIQLDALGYVGLADLSALGLFEEAHDLARSVCEFNARGRGETAECFADAFRFVETSSPVEVMRLENRLRDSLQFALSVVERCVCSLVPPFDTDTAGKKKKNEKQQQQNEDDIVGVKKPIGTIFARVKVEVDDPPRGESHICLPEHRLAVVIRRLEELDQLCMNHDLDVQANYDPPLNAAFNKEKSRLSSLGPCARVPRQCANSTEYLTSWQERMQQWMKLRVTATSCLVSPCSDAKQEEVRSMMKELGLLNSNENVFAEFWDVSVSVLGLFSSPKLNLTLAESIRSVDEKLTKSKDALVAEFVQSPRDVFERISLALLHPGMWIYAVVARLNIAHKKANKAKPFPYDVATFVAIRDATSKLFNKLSQLMSRLEESCKSMVEMGGTLEKIIPNGYEDAVHGAWNAVTDSRVESCKRLSALASFFSNLELHSA